MPGRLRSTVRKLASVRERQAAVLNDFWSLMPERYHEPHSNDPIAVGWRQAAAAVVESFERLGELLDLLVEKGRRQGVFEEPAVEEVATADN